MSDDKYEYIDIEQAICSPEMESYCIQSALQKLIKVPPILKVIEFHYKDGWTLEKIQEELKQYANKTYRIIYIKPIEGDNYTDENQYVHEQLKIDLLQAAKPYNIQVTEDYIDVVNRTMAILKDRAEGVFN